ncbi:MAG: RDD family protein [Arcobacter sp.]|nr:RDD family protein [Arcobacter sp.]
MARWRDVKKGKVSFLNKKSSKEFSSFCNSPLMTRFKAFITDSFMLLIPLMYIVFYFVMGSREAFAADKFHGWLYIFIPHFVAVVSFWYFKAQTPGMKAYEIAIINVYDGKQPSVFRLISRYIFMTSSIFLIIPLFIPYLNKRKRTTWDMLSGTCVKVLPNKTI